MRDQHGVSEGGLLSLLGEDGVHGVLDRVDEQVDKLTAPDG